MKKTSICVAVLAVLAYIALKYAIWLGLFQRVFTHGPPCVKLANIELGSEDIQVLSNGLAFISSGWRVSASAAYSGRPGHIFLFDFNAADVPPQPLNVQTPDGRNIELVSPHGLSLWTDNDVNNNNIETVFLYVICHLPQSDVVDKFRFVAESNTLVHLRRFENDSNFHMLNDLVVVGVDQFYFTNFFQSSPTLELGLGLHLGSVGFHDGTSTRLVDTGLFVPNGIAASTDGRLLFVAELGNEQVRVYRRQTDNSNITLTHSVKLWTKVDNLDVDRATGDLWVGAHPVLYRILEHMDDPSIQSPSQILRLKLTADGETVNIEEVLSDDGGKLSASSVAVRYKQGLLIGSVANGALYCVGIDG